MLKDRILVWQIQEGNKEALRQVYQKYKDDIFTIALSLLNEQAEAADVVGDVFIAFARSAQYLRFRRELKVYLLTLAINNISDRLRKKMYEVIRFDRPVQEQTNKPVEKPAAGNEESAVISDALANVMFQQRIVVCLRLQAGLNFGQIAGIVNIPANMAEARYYYGIEKLRSSLDRTIYKISDANHYGQIEESVKKLRWSTDEAADKKILEDTIGIFGAQAYRWRGWKYLIAAGAAAACAGVIVILAAIVVQNCPSGQKVKIVVRQAEPNKEIIKPTAVKEKVLPVKTEKAVPVQTELALKPDITALKQEEMNRQEELKQIIQLIASNDIEGLVKIISKAKPDNRLAASIYLANMGNKTAQEILDKLIAQTGSNEPNNIFAVTSAILKKKLEAQTSDVNKPAGEEKKIQRYEFVPRGVLSGLVKDAETDKPVGNVTVILHGPSNAQAVTDANGFYHFEKAEGEGKYEISIFSKYYLDGKDGRQIDEADLHNDVNTVRDLRLFMPACTIKIAVVNEANEPIKDAFVYEAGSVSNAEPNKAVYPAGTSERTDEKGEVILGCFESSEKEREFIATLNNYATEKLSAILNNPKVTPFYKVVLKKQTIADSNTPLQ